MRLGLGFGAHPVELVDPPAHRGDEVVDELVGRGLGLGREISRDVELADVVAERADGEVDRALPARLLLRRSGQARCRRTRNSPRRISRADRPHRRRATAPAAGPAAPPSGVLPTSAADAFERARLEDDDVVDACPVALRAARESRSRARTCAARQASSCCRSCSRRGSRPCVQWTSAILVSKSRIAFARAAAFGSPASVSTFVRCWRYLAFVSASFGSLDR